MNKKLIIRISNELGNQLFMYASSFAIAKKLDRILLVDDETAYLSRKNSSRGREKVKRKRAVKK